MRLIPKLHLSTAMLLMVVIGGMIGLNVMPIQAHLKTERKVCISPEGRRLEGQPSFPFAAMFRYQTIEIDGFAFGFPFTIAESKTPNILKAIRFNSGPLLLNVLIGLIALAIGVSFELWIQRKRLPDSSANHAAESA